MFRYNIYDRYNRKSHGYNRNWTRVEHRRDADHIHASYHTYSSILKSCFYRKRRNKRRRNKRRRFKNKTRQIKKKLLSLSLLSILSTVREYCRVFICFCINNNNGSCFIRSSIFLYIIPWQYYHSHQPIRDTCKCPNIDFSIPLI